MPHVRPDPRNRTREGPLSPVGSLRYYRDVFGRDRYFVELMDHGLSLEKRVRDDLLRGAGLAAGADRGTRAASRR